MNEAEKAILVKATALLARREHSRTELEAKLAARGFSERLIADALDVLEAENLLSDRRFTENFVHQRTARGQGPLKILYALRARGVSEEIAAQFIEAHGLQWCERALAARRKRFGVAPPQDIHERSRQARFLAQRGFGQEHIRFALDDRQP